MHSKAEVSYPFTCRKIPKQNDVQENSSADSFFWIFETDTECQSISQMVKIIQPTVESRLGFFPNHLKQLHDEKRDIARAAAREINVNYEPPIVPQRVSRRSTRRITADGITVRSNKVSITSDNIMDGLTPDQRECYDYAVQQLSPAMLDKIAAVKGDTGVAFLLAYLQKQQKQKQKKYIEDNQKLFFDREYFLNQESKQELFPENNLNGNYSNLESFNEQDSMSEKPQQSKLCNSSSNHDVFWVDLLKNTEHLQQNEFFFNKPNIHHQRMIPNNSATLPVNSCLLDPSSKNHVESEPILFQAIDNGKIKYFFNPHFLSEDDSTLSTSNPIVPKNLINSSTEISTAQSINLHSIDLSNNPLDPLVDHDIDLSIVKNSDPVIESEGDEKFYSEQNDLHLSPLYSFSQVSSLSENCIPLSPTMALEELSLDLKTRIMEDMAEIAEKLLCQAATLERSTYMDYQIALHPEAPGNPFKTFATELNKQISQCLLQLPPSCLTYPPSSQQDSIPYMLPSRFYSISSNL